MRAHDGVERDASRVDADGRSAGHDPDPAIASPQSVSRLRIDAGISRWIRSGRQADRGARRECSEVEIRSLDPLAHSIHAVPPSTRITASACDHATEA